MEDFLFKQCSIPKRKLFNLSEGVSGFGITPNTSGVSTGARKPQTLKSSNLDFVLGEKVAPLQRSSETLNRKIASIEAYFIKEKLEIHNAFGFATKPLNSDDLKKELLGNSSKEKIKELVAQLKLVCGSGHAFQGETRNGILDKIAQFLNEENHNTDLDSYLKSYCMSEQLKAKAAQFNLNFSDGVNYFKHQGEGYLKTYGTIDSYLEEHRIDDLEIGSRQGYDFLSSPNKLKQVKRFFKSSTLGIETLTADPCHDYGIKKVKALDNYIRFLKKFFAITDRDFLRFSHKDKPERAFYKIEDYLNFYEPTDLKVELRVPPHLRVGEISGATYSPFVEHSECARLFRLFLDKENKEHDLRLYMKSHNDDFFYNPITLENTPRGEFVFSFSHTKDGMNRIPLAELVPTIKSVSIGKRIPPSSYLDLVFTLLNPNDGDPVSYKLIEELHYLLPKPEKKKTGNKRTSSAVMLSLVSQILNKQELHLKRSYFALSKLSQSIGEGTASKRLNAYDAKTYFIDYYNKKESADPNLTLISTRESKTSGMVFKGYKYDTGTKKVNKFIFKFLPVKSIYEMPKVTVQQEGKVSELFLDEFLTQFHLIKAIDTVRRGDMVEITCPYNEHHFKDMQSCLDRVYHNAQRYDVSIKYQDPNGFLNIENYDQVRINIQAIDERSSETLLDQLRKNLQKTEPLEDVISVKLDKGMGTYTFESCDQIFKAIRDARIRSRDVSDYMCRWANIVQCLRSKMLTFTKIAMKAQFRELIEQLEAKTLEKAWVETGISKVEPRIELGIPSELEV